MLGMGVSNYYDRIYRPAPCFGKVLLRKNIDNVLVVYFSMFSKDKGAIKIIWKKLGEQGGGQNIML